MDEVDVADLPAEAQLALRAVAASEDTRDRLDRPRPLLPGAAIGLGALVLAILGGMVANGSGLVSAASWRAFTPWDTGQRTASLALSLLAAVLVLPAAVSVVRRRRAPFGSFWAVINDDLADVEMHRARLYPLARLEVDPDPPDRTLRLRIDGATVDIDLTLRGGATFAQTVEQRIEAAVAAKGERAGYRDAGPVKAGSPVGDRLAGASRARERPAAPPARQGRLVPWVLAVACGGAVGGFALPALRGSLSEGVTFRACTSAVEVTPCAAYLARFPAGPRLAAVDDAFFHLGRAGVADLEAYRSALPRGRHAGEIASTRARIFREAITAHRSRKLPPGDDVTAGAKLSALVLEALARTGEERTLHLRFEHAVERARLTAADVAQLREIAAKGQSPLEIVFALDAEKEQKDPLELLFPEDKMEPPSATAFPDDAARQHEDELTLSMERALTRSLPTLGLRVRRLNPGESPGFAAVVLDVGYTVTLRRQVVRGPGMLKETMRPLSFWEMSFRFTVGERPPSAGDARIAVEVHPPLDYTCVTQSDVYVAQRRAAFRLFADRWFAGFGVPIDKGGACPRAELRPRETKSLAGIDYLRELRHDLARGVRP